MLYTSQFSPAAAIRLLATAPARWHHAAMLNNARHIRLLPAGGKVTPQQTNAEGQYARELTEDAEYRQLLHAAAGTPE